MDIDTLTDKLRELFRRVPASYYLPIVIFGCGLIFLAVGITQMAKPKDPIDDLVGQETPITPKPLLITVDIEGAVVIPGVYSLPNTSRLKDALIAAGGMSADADRDAVARGLNLAVKITDGAKVYIPKIGETSTTSTVGGGSGTEQNTQVLGTTTGLININTATSEDLDSLPGIGQVTAQKIIAQRPYNSVEELLSKKVIGNSVFQKIKDKISVY